MLKQIPTLILQLIAGLLQAITPQKPQPAFVRIRLDVSGLDYIVPNRPDAIASARSAILDDLSQLVKYDELPDSIEVIPAPDASWEDVPSWLSDDNEDDAPETDGEP